MTSGTDELNDKQGKKIKKKSQNGCVTTWGQANIEITGYLTTRSFAILTLKKTLFEI